jgi:hypothetical protein
MNKIVTLFVCLFAHLFSVTLGQGVQVWYQPTSYPAKKYDGTLMPTDVKVSHVWDGWFSKKGINDLLHVRRYLDSLLLELGHKQIRLRLVR